MNNYEGSYGHMPTHLEIGHLGRKIPLKGSNNPKTIGANENPMDFSLHSLKDHGPPKKRKKSDIGMY